MVLQTPKTKANYHCLMADQRDALELSSCQDHCQSFFSQQTSDMTSRYLFISFNSFTNKYVQIPREVFESSVKTSGKRLFQHTQKKIIKKFFVRWLLLMKSFQIT